MHLLLVEDDPELANRLIHSLAQWNYTIDAVQTGSAAVAACSTTHYQLVILDLELPDMTGVEVIRQLRWQGLSAPILMLTARDELQDRVLEYMDGNDCVLKPFSIGELVARIRALLKGASSRAATALRFGKLDFDAASGFSGPLDYIDCPCAGSTRTVVASTRCSANSSFLSFLTRSLWPGRTTTRMLGLEWNLRSPWRDHGAKPRGNRMNTETAPVVPAPFSR